MITSPESWPLIASDPGWEMRRGPASQVTTPTGEVVSAVLTWTSDAGIAAELTLDDAPLGPLASLTLDQLTAVEIVSSSAAGIWRRIREGNK